MPNRTYRHGRNVEEHNEAGSNQLHSQLPEVVRYSRADAGNDLDAFISYVEASATAHVVTLVAIAIYRS